MLMSGEELQEYGKRLIPGKKILFNYRETAMF